MTKAIPGCLFTILGAVMIWQMLTATSRPPQLGDPGPWVFPTMLAICLIGFGATEAIRQVLKTRGVSTLPHQTTEVGQASEVNPAAGVQEPPVIWARLAIFGVVLAYVLVFERLGFTISSTLFLFAMIFLLGERTLRSAATSAIAAVIAVVTIAFVLVWLVGVPLPGALIF